MDSVPVGRDAEIAEIWAFLSAASVAPTALAITGDPGMGKTVVWKHLVQAADLSFRVLSRQQTAAHRPLAFSALADLLGDVAAEVVPVLPSRQRRAVEVALVRDPSREPPAIDLPETADQVPEGRVLARGVSDALRILSRGASILLAVNDAQRLDRLSAGVLEFCFRRRAGWG